MSVQEDGIIFGSNKDRTMFVPAYIDDYGFNPVEFRVFARIMRRVGDGEEGRICFERIPVMAKALRTGEESVRRALKVLEDCRAIKRIRRPGKSDLVTFQPCSKWASPKKLADIRAGIDSGPKEDDRQRKIAEKSRKIDVSEGTRIKSETTDPSRICDDNKVLHIKGTPAQDSAPNGAGVPPTDFTNLFGPNLGTPPSPITPPSEARVPEAGSPGVSPMERWIGVNTGNNDVLVVDNHSFIFQHGLGFLISSGVKEQQGRAFLGKLRKKYHDQDIVAMIQSLPEGRSEYISYMTEVMKKYLPKDHHLKTNEELAAERAVEWTVALAPKREHVWYKCPPNCDDATCMFCMGGLSSCTVCGQAEGTLEPSCPGPKLETV